MGLVLVLDATHTPNHQASGLTPEDMGHVARAYARLALDQPRVAGVIAYAWPGGIDGGHERGVRDLPAAVIEAHRQVGAMLLGPHSGDP
jgi:hypothetical protein